MPREMRETLRREVARNLEARRGIPEPMPARVAEGWWKRCRDLIGRIGPGLGVVIAVAALLRSPSGNPGRPEIDSRAERILASAREVGGNGDFVSDGAGGLGNFRKTSAFPSRPVAASVRAPVPRVVIPVGRLDLSAARELKNPLDGAVRLRRRYVASAETNATAAESVPMFHRFEVARTPGRVELRDASGLVVAGRVEALPGSASGTIRQWVFEGRGTNIQVGGEVLVTGHFGSAGDSSAPEADQFMDAPFSGTAVMADGKVVEIRAVPEP